MDGPTFPSQWQHSNTIYPPLLDHDEDQEDIGQILSRLEEVRIRPQLPKVHCKCTCFTLTESGAKERITSTCNVYSSEDSSSTDDEEEEFNLEKLLKTFEVYKKKNRFGRNSLAILNLAQSYGGNEPLKEEQANQIVQLMEDENISIRVAVVITIGQLCALRGNACVLLDMGILSTILDILDQDGSVQLHEAAARAVEKICSHVDLEDAWLEEMMTAGLQTLVRRVSAQEGAGVQLAAARTIRSLAEHPQMAILILDQAMPALLAIKDRSAKLKEVFTEILSKLVLHTDHTRSSVLDYDAFPIALGMLKQGPCGPQKQALLFFTSLCHSDSGIATVLEESLLPCLLSALKDTYCRHVRCAGTSLLNQLTSSKRSSHQRALLLQVHHFFHEPDEQGEPGRDTRQDTSRTDYSISPLKAKREKEAKIEQGLDDLVKIVLDLLRKEARIELDDLGMVHTVLHKPCIDVDDTKLRTITQLVDILHNSCYLSTGHTRTRSTFQNDLNLRDRKQKRKRFNKVNMEAVKVLLENGTLCVINVLFVFTQKLQQVSASNIASLTTTPSPSSTTIGTKQDLHCKKSDILCIFEATEISLVCHLIVLIAAISSCSAEVHSFSSSLEMEIIDKLAEEKSHLENATSFHEMNPKYDIPGAQQGHSMVKTEARSLEKFTAKNGHDISKKQSEKSSWSEKSNDRSIERVWNPENPFLSRTLPHEFTAKNHSCGNVNKGGVPAGRPPPPPSTIEALEQAQRESAEKQLRMWRRGLRRTLYEQGIFECLAPWLAVEDHTIKNHVYDILQFLIQPVEERLIPKPQDIGTKPPQHLLGKIRPQSAITTKEHLKDLDKALSEMSSNMARFIKDALGSDVQEALSKDPLNGHKRKTKPEGNGSHTEKSFFTKVPHKSSSFEESTKHPRKEKNKGIAGSSSRPCSAKHSSSSNKAARESHQRSLSSRRKGLAAGMLQAPPRPVLDLSQPIASQCRGKLVEECGCQLLQDLLHKDQEIRKSSALFLEKLALQDDVSMCMKLSEKGLMPRMVDFLRINEDDLLLETIGLIVSRLLISRDSRLQQLFHRQGGTTLLMAMAGYTRPGLLRDEITKTLKSATQSCRPAEKPCRGRRVQSAPVGRARPARGTADVWDHIMLRWRQEDKVARILTKWLTH